MIRLESGRRPAARRGCRRGSGTPGEPGVGVIDVPGRRRAPLPGLRAQERRAGARARPAATSAWRCCASVAASTASYSGSGPIWALGGCSTVELRTAPEPPRMEVLGVTFESTDGAETDGTVADGTLVAPSVVMVAALDPQFVHGALIDVGLV